MDLRSELKSSRLYLDGAMGTLLQRGGLRPGELPERWNILHPDIVSDVHKSYFDAGSNIVCTNTFGANGLKFPNDELKRIISAAVGCAEHAAAESTAPQNKYIALDVGPLGRLLRPYGDLDFEKAVSLFSESIKIGAGCGVDLIFIETMNDSYETKAAVLAAKESCSLPVFVSNAYGEDGRLLSGTPAAAMAAMLEGLGADAIGTNCSFGPKQLSAVAAELLRYASVPVFIKPNAGMPVQRGGVTVYDIDADGFAEELAATAKLGVNILGGCCGTDPEYIRRTVEYTCKLGFIPVEKKTRTLVSSSARCVEIGGGPVLIGERINPTGRPVFRKAISEGDIDIVLKEGVTQAEQGADIIDVNVGAPGIDESAMLSRAVCELQAVVDIPLQLDSSDAAALDAAMRIYNGKPLVNSVNGKEESMKAVFPLIKKYGGVAVALTLDEDGIPKSAQGRFEIAKKILACAESYGIERKDMIFDTLCMSVSAEPEAAKVTLDSLRLIEEKLGANTVLGVSNVSFGLPLRADINASFLLLALENGLDAAIVNPYSVEIMKAYRCFRLLHGMDGRCTEFIGFAGTLEGTVGPKADASVPEEMTLKDAVIKGLKDRAGELCALLLTSETPLDIIDKHIVPALDEVGRGFEEKKVFLPQLLMSAEAAKCAAEKVKNALLKDGTGQKKKAKFVLATVKGDIHDIGKNIVKVLLENYGFDVIDLGKDVPPETVLDAVAAHHAPFCGLSALMTTTVPAMEETVKLIKEKAPFCKTVVGGAVLTAEYAASIGADKYAADAMETVRFAEENL